MTTTTTSREHRLQRAFGACQQAIGGFLDVETLGWGFDSLRRFKFLPGNTGRTRRPEFQQRRKRHVTGNSSISLFFQLSALVASTVAVAANVAPAPGQDPVRKVGDDFESMMLDFMFQQLRNSESLAGPDNPFAPSGGEKIFRAMRDQEMMKAIAGQRPLGVGNMVERQLRGQSGIGYRPLVRSVQAPKTAVAPVATPGG